jgi:ribosomal protein L40E
MNFKAMSRALRLAGIGAIILAVLWWMLFFVQVTKHMGGTLLDAFPCLYSSRMGCSMIAAGAEFIGKTAYSPTIFWVGIAAYALGWLLKIGGAATGTDAEMELSPHRTCPHCAERVRLEAKVCRFCQRDLPELSAEYIAQNTFGHCPNCNERLPMSAQSCSKCTASFADGSIWKIVPVKHAE